MTQGRNPQQSVYTRTKPFTVRFDPSLERGRKAYYCGGSLVRTCPLGEIAYGEWTEVRFSPADAWVWPDGEGEFPKQ